MNLEKSSKLLRLPFLGFCIALAGGAINALGWYVFDSRTLVVIGFYTVVFGVLFGVGMIIFGQIIVLTGWFSKKDARDEPTEKIDIHRPSELD